MRPFKSQLQIYNDDFNDLYMYMDMHIYVYVAMDLMSWRGIIESSTPAMGKYGLLTKMMMMIIYIYI